MTLDPKRPYRRSPRMPGYDYSQASAYLVSTLVDDRTHRFGEIIDGIMQCNHAGEMIEATWKRLPDRFPSVELDAFVVMPNHFHGIVFIGTNSDVAPPSLSRVMHVFKSESAVEYGRGIRAGIFPAVRRGLWQHSFHDRIIVSSQVVANAREYVENNPHRWQEDMNRYRGDRLSDGHE